MKFNSQICTSIKQSQRLIALGLKRETADMYISNGIICAKPYSEVMEFMRGVPIREVIIPAWSLHRLWDILPKDVEVDDDCYATSHLEGEKAIVYHDYGYHCYNFDRKNNIYDNLIDCIEWLIKEGYFSKEYLE